MRGRCCFHYWGCLGLALILLSANVRAPFRTPLGRLLLSGVNHDVATRSVVRVRVVSPSGASCGFRVVVGLSRGGSEGDVSAPRPRVHFVFTFVPPARPHREGACSVARPHPFPRC
jgi:hypothetical protein